MTTDDHAQPPDRAEGDDDGFAEAQQRAMERIGQALIEQSLPGTAAMEAVVMQAVSGSDVHLDVRLTMVRSSGIAFPAVVSDALVEAVQQLILLWRDHGREPFRTFTYRLVRGESGPTFTSEFEV